MFLLTVQVLTFDRILVFLIVEYLLMLYQMD